jgi:signal transduction histidine kinase
MRKSGGYPGSPLVSRSLTLRFVTVLLGGAAIAIVCTAIFSYYHAYRLRRDGGGAAMQRVAESLSEQIDISLDTAIHLLTQLAAAEEIRGAFAAQSKRSEGVLPLGIAEAERALARFASRNPSFGLVRAVDRGGAVVAASGKPESLYPGRDEWWRQAKMANQDDPQIYEPVFTDAPLSMLVRLYIPVFSAESGDVQGKLLAEYRLDHTVSLSGTDREEIVAFLLADSNERRLHILSPPGLASSRPTNFRENGEKIGPGKRGSSSVTLGQHGIRAIAGFAPVKHSLTSVPVIYKDKDWSLVAATPESRVMAPLNSLFFQAIGFSAAMLILVSLGGLAFARRILRPIHVLQDGVEEIGQGNLEHRIDIRSGDEIEVLAVEFNRMADRMQRTNEQLQRRSKELEQRVNQLRRLQAQLMQSERMAATGELAAQIAHEINNPLGIIKNYVGIAKMLMPEEDSNRENLKIVDQEINRIAGIVRRLLKFAKPGMEDIQPVQINQILEELLALLRGQLFRAKIETSSELAENLPEVSVSTDQIRQVFLNLIKNAEDAMPNGGRLSIRTRYRKGRVEIDIADDGCGIPSEEVKNIFEPFFTTKGVKGTGLGLSVSYGIVKNYNGEISVDSEPGRGTTFTIQLPVVSDKVFQVIQSP